jgi:flagellar motor switch protein FliG
LLKSVAMLTGPEKAVLFLLSLDESVAAPIVNELREPELRRLREVAATMREVRTDSIDHVFKDFLDASSTAVAVPHGGLPYLRRLTAGALGEQRAREVFEDGVTSPLARLEAARPEALAALLEKEPVQLAAAIVARLEPEQAASVVGAMPVERQLAILTRVSRLTELPAGALEDVAGALAEALPSPGAETLISIDGVARAAQLLNAAGRASSAALLQQLELLEPDLSRSLRLAMFTFEDLVRIDARNMRTLLREIPTERLTVALKGASPEVTLAVFAGLSQRASELIKDDLELLGSIRKAEIEKARVEIVEIALRLEGEGTVNLGRGDE